MSQCRHDIRCTEGKVGIWRQTWNSQLKWRGMLKTAKKCQMGRLQKLTQKPPPVRGSCLKCILGRLSVQLHLRNAPISASKYSEVAAPRLRPPEIRGDEFLPATILSLSTREKYLRILLAAGASSHNLCLNSPPCNLTGGYFHSYGVPVII